MLRGADYSDFLTGIGGSLSGSSPGTYGYQVVKEDLERNGGASFYNRNPDVLMEKLADIGNGAQDFLYKGWTNSSC